MKRRNLITDLVFEVHHTHTSYSSLYPVSPLQTLTMGLIVRTLLCPREGSQSCLTRSGLSLVPTETVDDFIDYTSSPIHGMQHYG